MEQEYCGDAAEFEDEDDGRNAKRCSWCLTYPWFG
jgi:hypothetical protein